MPNIALNDVMQGVVGLPVDERREATNELLQFGECFSGSLIVLPTGSPS
jgi:hypothetical protein